MLIQMTKFRTHNIYILKFKRHINTSDKIHKKFIKFVVRTNGFPKGPSNLNCRYQSQSISY